MPHAARVVACVGAYTLGLVVSAGRLVIWPLSGVSYFVTQRRPIGTVSAVSGHLVAVVTRC